MLSTTSPSANAPSACKIAISAFTAFGLVILFACSLAVVATAEDAGSGTKSDDPAMTSNEGTSNEGTSGGGGLFGNFDKKLKAAKKEKQKQSKARKAMQTANEPAMKDGSAKMSSDQGSGTRMEDGSGTRGDDSAMISSRRPITSYEPLEPTQVDPDLAAQVAESADEIDRLVREKLRAEKIKPNPLTNDLQFVRRVYLDITGTIPTARQTAAFLKKGRSSNKRAELIDELLNSTGYVSHSFNYWADILRLKDMPNNDNYGLPYVEWIKDVLASDMPFDEFVYRMLSAEGRVWENPAAGYMLRDLGMQLSNLDNTVRIFMGTRIGCAQCHDHPFDRWTQKEFYQLAAFVHGTENSANRREIDQAVSATRKELKELADTTENGRLRQRTNQLIRFNQRSLGENLNRQLKLPHDYQYSDGNPGDVIEPAVILGEQPELKPNASRRETFAKWLSSPENPRFTLTIANRLWKRALGVGVIDPVDDLTDESEPTNPELMDFLVAEMKRVNYSQREFLRIIYNSKTYQREASRKDLVADEPYHFPGPTLRRMTAEQVWDSMLTLTLADPNRYQRPRSERMIEVVAINPGQPVSLDEFREKLKQRDYERRNGQEAKLKKENTHKGELLVRASEMPLPLNPAHFLRQFGQSDRELIAGGSTEGHVPQILTMFNGQISHKLLYEGTVIYDEVQAAADLRDKIEIVFLSILSRKPTRTDRNLAMAEIQSNGPAGFGNVIWALLNTREFLFIQ